MGICFGVHINSLKKKKSVNSSLPSAAYMRRWTWSALVQIVACRLFGAKPFSKPVLGYCQLDPLLWRHNGRDSVSNHQPHHCLLKRLFRRRSKKKSKLRVTGLCVGNSPGTGEFPAQMASNAENVSIWWRHHALGIHFREILIKTQKTAFTKMLLKISSAKCRPSCPGIDELICNNPNFSFCFEISNIYLAKAITIYVRCTSISHRPSLDHFNMSFVDYTDTDLK